ncbi:phage tail protein [Dactylosporangium vinaceum]|uniref:Phage tail protein n=1 Tax=Dactylosporangium vinaceum TaxID=53362 RepID=A0ABV5LZ87_9ACTN|nr:phage tail protein [Dactylosporangium vinaceum]UAB92557.1 phage tail protein [Dactylosporangium vinaceum]
MRSADIERLLPAVYQRAAGTGGPLAALLDVMEGMHEPVEGRLAAVDDLVAPYRTPDAFLPYLLGWLAMDHIGRSLPPGRQRDLAARAGELARTRGTAAGLCALLATVTGVAGFVIDEPADRPFHIVVRVPAAAHDQLPLIRVAVALEKPAAVTADIAEEA